MKKGALLAAVLALLLVGAWALSSYISSDVGPVEAPAPADPIERVTNPRIEERESEPPQRVEVPPPPAAPVAAPARTPDELKAMGLTPPPPPEGAKPAEPNDAVPVAADPWTDPESRELDYAFSLLTRPDAGKEEWGKAAEVFERCVKQAPQVAVCQDGLLRAQALYLGEPLPVETKDPKIGPWKPGAAERPARLKDVDAVPSPREPMRRLRSP